MSVATVPPRVAAPARLPWMPWALAACALLVLAGGLSHRPLLGVAGAALLLVAWLPVLWRRRSVGVLLAWLLLAALLLVPSALGHPSLALMALPVLCLSGLAWVFGRTLRRGREPLVSRFVRVIEGDARLALPGVRGYTRGVTLYWAVLLAGMALLSLLVALCTQPGGWLAVFGWRAPLALPAPLLVWYPVVGCWAVLVAAFAAEYAFRRWYLRGIPHPPVRQFVVRVAQRWPTLVRDGNDPA